MHLGRFKLSLLVHLCGLSLLQTACLLAACCTSSSNQRSLYVMIRDVSGVGRRNYAVGETYVEYGVGRKMAP
jgi:hypothetical protein